MARTLISGGTVVTAADSYAADVVIADGKIAAIFAPGQLPPGVLGGGAFDAILDARGKLVMPGGIDVHTHLDMPFGGTTASDDFETGTRAAVYGGTTAIVDFAIQSKGEALRAGLDRWHAKADGKAAIDYSFHLIMTDVNEEVAAEMGRVVGEGVSSFKLFMAYPGALMADDGQIFRALQRGGELGAMICIHAESGLPIEILVKQALAAGHTAPKYHALTRPELAEAEGAHRAICLAEMAEAPVYLVHLSAARALRHVAEARDRGLPTYAETCPQYLFLTEAELSRPGFEGAKFVCTPPLRTKETQEELWRGLRTHDLQVVSTNHCPFCMKGQKELGRDSFAKIPNGMPGIETRLYLLWDGGVRTGRISMNRFVEITSTAPARIFGLYPNKGTIAVGSDADIVIWDPEKRHVLGQETLHMRVDYSPYEGLPVVGAPSHVLSRGRLLVENFKYLGRPGDGRFVKRSTFAES